MTPSHSWAFFLIIFFFFFSFFFRKPRVHGRVFQLQVLPLALLIFFGYSLFQKSSLLVTVFPNGDLVSEQPRLRCSTLAAACCAEFLAGACCLPNTDQRHWREEPGRVGAGVPSLQRGEAGRAHARCRVGVAYGAVNHRALRGRRWRRREDGGRWERRGGRPRPHGTPFSQPTRERALGPDSCIPRGQPGGRDSAGQGAPRVPRSASGRPPAPAARTSANPRRRSRCA